MRADDLAETAFAFSPLNEAVFSLRAWKYPGLHPEHTAGLRQMRPAYRALDVELLGALVTWRRFIPDFLTPRPASTLPSAGESFAALRATPPEVVRDHVLRAYAGSPLPPPLADAESSPGVLLSRIAAALEAYWERCLAPWWPRMRALLEADIAHRGRCLALGGAQALFAGLDKRVSWRGGVLRVTLLADGLDQTVAVGGRGLVLTPSLFIRHALTMIDANGPPQLVYPARGRAALWERAGAVASTAALDELLGVPRSRLLSMLNQPASTTELARLLGVTAGGVSRHLTALYGARLLNRSRSGRNVLYFRSPLGNALVAEGEDARSRPATGSPDEPART